MATSPEAPSPLPERRCTCGRTQAVERVRLEVDVRCRACAEAGTLTRAYDVTAGAELPDLRPLLSPSDEITAVLPAGDTPLADTRDLPAVTPSAAEALSDGEIPILAAGTRLGSFEIEETLGKGGMGVVYRAHDRSLDRAVALKVLSPHLGRNLVFIERFRREAVACGKLSHPNITHIYSIAPEGEAVQYFAMEYVDGANLSEWVRREGAFPVERVFDVARQAARGLREAAAAGIIHRDVKPSNVLLTAEGKVKITDFGLAKARATLGQTLDLTSTGVVMGTPLYMSPEQGRGAKIDARADIYSLGGTLFFLAFGCPPFDADSAVAIILKHIREPVRFPQREVGEGIKGLLLRMLAKEPSRRPADYDALLDDIDRASRGELRAGSDAPRVYVLAKSPKQGRRTTGIFRSGLKASKLSVARTNLKLGRREKAVSLLLETIEDGDPGLRSDAALLLLQLFEKEGDHEQTRRMAEVVVREAVDPTAVAFARWRLAALAERVALEANQAALERYRALLAAPPAGLPREVIEEQVRRLEAKVADAERDAGTTRVVLGDR